MTNPPSPSPSSAPASGAETPALDWICTKCRRVGRAADLTHAQACHDLLYPPCGYCAGPLTPPRCTCRDFQSFGECSHVLAAPTPESPREAGREACERHGHAKNCICDPCVDRGCTVPAAAPTTEGPRAEPTLGFDSLAQWSRRQSENTNPLAASRPGAPEPGYLSRESRRALEDAMMTDAVPVTIIPTSELAALTSEVARTRDAAEALRHEMWAKAEEVEALKDRFHEVCVDADNLREERAALRKERDDLKEQLDARINRRSKPL